MLTIAQTRDLLAIVVPVHFEPSVERSVAAAILERTFAEHRLFCDVGNTLLVVDEGSAAESVLRAAGSSSPLHGLPSLVLERNQGKSGAVRMGLEALLATTRASFLATRDCDGDAPLEDLPRLATMAQHMRSDANVDCVSVFGVRPSLLKPMGWIREEWERLTTAVFVDLTELLLARSGQVIDRRFWNGYPLDLQGGSRLYSREAAQAAVGSLSELPDQPEVYLLACETLPFPAISLQGGLIGQVQISTRLQPQVSSYRDLPFAKYYAALLTWFAKRRDVPSRVLLRIFDNHLVSSSAYHSAVRDQFLECRSRISPGAPPPIGPKLL